MTRRTRGGRNDAFSLKRKCFEKNSSFSGARVVVISQRGETEIKRSWGATTSPKRNGNISKTDSFRGQRCVKRQDPVLITTRTSGQRYPPPSTSGHTDRRPISVLPCFYGKKSAVAVAVPENGAFSTIIVDNHCRSPVPSAVLDGIDGCGVRGSTLVFRSDRNSIKITRCHVAQAAGRKSTADRVRKKKPSPKSNPKSNFYFISIF